MKNAAVHVKDSHPHVGKGLFAGVPIKRGNFIAEYKGKKIPTTIADTLTTRYLFDLENGWTLDGEDESNLARYINHSCKPNCEAELNDERIFVYARRNIKPGEECTIDYGEEYFNEFIAPVGCKCAICDKTLFLKTSP